MTGQPNRQPSTSIRLPVTRRILYSLIPVVCLCLASELIARLCLPMSGGNARLQQMEQVCIYLGNRPGESLFAFDQRCFWKLKSDVRLPESRGSKWGGRMSNRLGFRNAEFSLNKQDSRRRIVCYGDSTTFGFGVHMHESWPAQLQAELAPADHGSIQVVNAGVPGYSSFQGARYMAQSLPRLDADLVIATFGNNDAWRWDNLSDQEHGMRIQAATLGGEWHGSRALTVLSRLAAGSPQADLAAEPAWARRVSENFFQPVPAWRPRVNQREFVCNLEDMISCCRKNGTHLLLIAWPDYFQVQGRITVRDRYQELIRRTADRHDNVRCLDLLPVFRERYPTCLGYYLKQDIIHVNAAGNRLVADTIRQLLSEILPLADARG